jgi:uncharacterized protein YccT (UPF0319 family)
MEQFDAAPNWSLTSSQGDVQYKTVALTKSGMQFTRDLKEEVQEYNFANQALSLPSLYSQRVLNNPTPVYDGKVTYSVQSAETSAPQNIEESLVIKNLKYWFDSANQYEKAEFIRWLNAK